MNGLEISSSPSTGQISVIVGPRTTVRPSVRVRGSGSTRCQWNSKSIKKGRVDDEAEIDIVPCICSSTSSRTRLNNWSYPLSTPVTDIRRIIIIESGGHQPTLGGSRMEIRDVPSRPPVNLTRMRALAYFARSRIASRFGLSSVGWGPCGPPWRPPPPRWEDDPPPPPRCAPRPMPPRPWKSEVARSQVTISLRGNVLEGV